ncbi:MAG: hypothetical protein KDJ45_14760 [Hyphomicrobiaceae bacterium]|nr:hypothetical protein [Hyphomicrobiaceae bacterium]MCC0010088.1 hypothetical protein [Hyphomicrobiaceae bacterium]
MMPSKLLAFLLSILAIFAVADIYRDASMRLSLLHDVTASQGVEKVALETNASTNAANGTVLNADPVQDSALMARASTDRGSEFAGSDVAGVVKANWQGNPRD